MNTAIQSLLECQFLVGTLLELICDVLIHSSKGDVS